MAAKPHDRPPADWTPSEAREPGKRNVPVSALGPTPECQHGGKQEHRPGVQCPAIDIPGRSESIPTADTGLPLAAAPTPNPSTGLLPPAAPHPKPQHGPPIACHPPPRIPAQASNCLHPDPQHGPPTGCHPDPQPCHPDPQPGPPTGCRPQPQHGPPVSCHPQLPAQASTSRRPNPSTGLQPPAAPTQRPAASAQTGLRALRSAKLPAVTWLLPTAPPPTWGRAQLHLPRSRRGQLIPAVPEVWCGRDSSSPPRPQTAPPAQPRQATHGP
ncbi:proline-rich protein 2-like [Lepus europaeus]|uniref:proline-rich protein 2-like n=1 Tax=Lepus europaeus TaxID=9983 RepID=UPI002B45FA4D|nr:proline-rich protein 2-like [Lepus europaeus]